MLIAALLIALVLLAVVLLYHESDPGRRAVHGLARLAARAVRRLWAALKTVAVLTLFYTAGVARLVRHAGRPPAREER